MSVGRGLLRLYPAAMRARWGGDLEAELRAGGWAAVPALVAGILDMWLHPVVWPAASPAQRRCRAAVMGCAVALGGWLLGHFLVEDGTLVPAGLVHSPVLNACDVLVVAGLVLIAPYPRPDAASLLASLRRGVRRLGVPAALGAAVVGWARWDAAGSSPAMRHAVLLAWWVALTAGAVQACRLMADLGAAGAEPPAFRLRLGMWSLVAALGAGGAVVVASAIHRGGHAAPAAGLGGLMILLTLAAAVTIRDLSELPAPGS